MVMCESYMIQISVSKYQQQQQQKWYNKGGDNREGSATFMSNTHYQRIEN